MRKYLRHLEHNLGRDAATVYQAQLAIADFERASRSHDFRAFRDEWVDAYKDHLADYVSPLTKRPLAMNSRIAKLRVVRQFMCWLSEQPGYRSKITRSMAEAFSPSTRDKRAARTGRRKYPPTVEQLEHMVRSHPVETFAQRRGRAILAALVLTGARAGALAAVRLGDLDLERRTVWFDGEAGAKNGKGHTADFFPVPSTFETVLSEWTFELRTTHHFGLGDPLFPSVETGFTGQGTPRNGEPKRAVTRGSTIIRKACRAACSAAGLPVFTPHAVRSTVITLMTELCRTWEEQRAVSLNVGHSHHRTTEGYVAPLSDERQAEIMSRLRERVRADPPAYA